MHNPNRVPVSKGASLGNAVIGSKAFSNGRMERILVFISGLCRSLGPDREMGLGPSRGEGAEVQVSSPKPFPRER